MTAVTLNYVQALERELVIHHERLDAAAQRRRSHFSMMHGTRAVADREAAARAFKEQREYFALMGLDWKEAS